MTRTLNGRPDGKPGHEIEQEITDRMLEAPCLHRCDNCDWTFVGPAAEGIAAFKDHRRAEHGVAWRNRQRAKRHGAPPTGQDVIANVARARSQGAGQGAERQARKERAHGRVVCKHDGCTLSPTEHHGRFAGLCHEHKLRAARKPRV